MDPNNPYYAYYKAQTGSGSAPYYQSRFAVQGGRGVFGNLLRGAWGFLRPLFGSAAKHIGAEALTQGSNIIKDTISSPNESVANIARNRSQEGLANLAKKAVSALTGSGGHPRRTTSSSSPRKKKKIKRNSMSGSGSAQSSAKRRASRTTRGRGRGTGLTNRPAIRDIFSPPSP